MTDNKQLVLSWFQAGPSSDAGRAMVTDDFVWHMPRSMAPLMNDGDPDVRGRDAMLHLNAIDKAVYTGGETTFEMTFCIAEGEFVAVQAEIGATSFEGDKYHNTYVFSFRCRDGKIAEVWENVDTKQFCDIILGRPEQRDAVERRLAEISAGSQ